MDVWHMCECACKRERERKKKAWITKAHKGKRKYIIPASGHSRARHFYFIPAAIAFAFSLVYVRECPRAFCFDSFRPASSTPMNNLVGKG